MILGRADNWSFFNSVAVTLQDSRESDLNFFKALRWCSPSLVMREFDTFREIRSVNPEINSNVLSVRWQFCERFKKIKDARSLMFITPTSVSDPPHTSSDRRFFKCRKQLVPVSVIRAPKRSSWVNLVRQVSVESPASVILRESRFKDLRDVNPDRCLRLWSLIWVNERFILSSLVKPAN